MSKIILRAIQSGYAVARRARVLETTRLLVGPVPNSSACQTINQAVSYSLPTAEELRRLVEVNLCPHQVGAPETLLTKPRHVILATFERQVVGFVWIAREHVAADENFSRTQSLGTAMKLSPTTAFIFNAWVTPQHRGQSILASMIFQAVEKALSGITELATTMDWTNAASCAAFKKLGMKEIGIITRLGIGRFQLTRAPEQARERGIIILKH